MEKVVSMPTQPQSPILKSFKSPKSTDAREKAMLVVIAILVIIAGIGTGKILSVKAAPSGGSEYSGSPNTKAAATVSRDEMGVSDESTFKDSVEGKLVSGGIDGEGTFHLERPGGVSQNVYLTSTVVDLGGFEGKKVKVWGQTLAGKKAGWLMDVGKIKVLE